MLELNAIVNSALKATRKAGPISKRIRKNIRIGFKNEPRPTLFYTAAAGIVTDADIKVQEAILRTFLKDGFGYCQVVAEEDTPSVNDFAQTGSSKLFIDPIDGTINYAWGNPITRNALVEKHGEDKIRTIEGFLNPKNYGIVIGFEKNGECVLGVCSLPAQNIVYHAVKGQGIFRNGLPFHPILSDTRKVILHPRHSEESSLRPFEAASFAWEMTCSAPSNLHKFFTGECSSFVSTKMGSAWQVHAFIAKEAGFSVLDAWGNEIPLRNLAEKKHSLIISTNHSMALELAEITLKNLCA